MDRLGVPVDKTVVDVLTTCGAMMPKPAEQHVTACGSNYMLVSNCALGVSRNGRVA